MTHAVGQSSPSFSHLPVAGVLERMARDKYDVWEVFGEGRHYLPENEAEFVVIFTS
jgi:hypothetical protein